MNDPPSPPDKPDHYIVLGLSQYATTSEIYNAYKTLQRKHHPDSRLVGSIPDEQKYKEVGVAFDTLGNERLRARYDKIYHQVRSLWNAYRVNLHNWNKQQKDEEQRRARIDAQRRKRAEDDVRRKEQSIKRAAYIAAEVARKKRELEEQQKRQWEQAKAEVQRKKAAQDKRLQENQLNNEQPSSNEADQERRERWQAAQERTRRQAQAAEEANTRAAQERLRRQQQQEEEDVKQRAAAEEAQQDETSTQHPEAHTTYPTAGKDGTQDDDAHAAEESRRERLAEKQRAAEARQQRVFEEARSRQAYAAKQRLRSQQPIAQSFKRSAASADEDEDVNKNVKRTKPDYSRRTKIALAREWSHHKHAERLEQVGGKGNEYLLRDTIIDLGWEHIKIDGQCDFCYKKGISRIFGLWKCPDGGAMVCKPCMNRFSTFGA
ncbi:Nn.00g007230.m01.CDS01 [Neocucurbitaria sp. VM-36]